VQRAAERPVAAGRSRRTALAALALGVSVAHLWLVDQHLPARLGEGASDNPVRRFDVSFVRELEATQPPAGPPLRAAARPAGAPRPAASAAQAEGARAPPRERAPELPPLPVAQPSLQPLEQAAPKVDVQPPDAVAESLPAGPTPLPTTTPTPTPTPASFEWPPSTRLSYTLTGDFRGPVQGQARVEWLRSGSRYQVHLDLSVGPSFAPLISRRITSEGDITAEGLQPRRYDEETKVALREARRLTIWLDPDRVRLPGGAEWPRPPGVQDSASQFVQMTWLFTTQPQRLQPGQTVQLPLALPRRLEPWLYDVQETATLDTPAGRIDTVHVKPRREGRAGDLTAEFWVAPSLQYLPVRILIRQDAQSYVDLLIERLPQQAERGR